MNEEEFKLTLTLLGWLTTNSFRWYKNNSILVMRTYNSKFPISYRIHTEKFMSEWTNFNSYEEFLEYIQDD